MSSNHRIPTRDELKRQNAKADQHQLLVAMRREDPETPEDQERIKAAEEKRVRRAVRNALNGSSGK